MSIVANSTRFFNQFIAEALKKQVKVDLNYDENTFVGTLVGYNQDNQSIVLENAKDSMGNTFPLVFIQGGNWGVMVIQAPLFPMREFVQVMSKIIPAEEIQFDESTNTITALNGKIKVTPEGVKGIGSSKERVQKAFNEFKRKRGL